MLAVVNLQRHKVVRCVQFYWARSYFSITERCLQKKKKKKNSVWPSSTLKAVDLEYHLSLLVARVVRSWFKSLQSFSTYMYA